MATKTACRPFACTLCDKRFKKAGHLKQHRADVHNIGVVWHQCTLCDGRFKQTGNLNKHRAFVHDIGPYQCDYCFGNRNSRIKYTDPRLSEPVHICRQCFNTATGKNSRVELTWSDFLDKQLGTEFLLSSDRSMRSLGGCSRKRPDKLYASPDRIIVGECDEKQHRYANGSYTCEEERLSELYDEPSICGKPMAVIRWNPDRYTPPKGQARVPRKERLALYLALHRKLSQPAPVGSEWPRVAVYYMFYDQDSLQITKNLPHKLIYTHADVEKVHPDTIN